MRLSLRIQLSRRHGEVRRPHPAKAIATDGRPAEQILLGLAVTPERPCWAAQARLAKPGDVAHPCIWVFLPHPAPETITDIPVEAGKDFRHSGAVAVIIRPSAQDRIQSLERLSQRTAGCIPARQLLDLIPKISGFYFWYLGARGVPEAPIPSQTDPESEEFESIGQSRNLGLFRRQFETRCPAEMRSQRLFFGDGVVLTRALGEERMIVHWREAYPGFDIDPSIRVERSWRRNFVHMVSGQAVACTDVGLLRTLIVFVAPRGRPA
jgi:hypothetical protein